MHCHRPLLCAALLSLFFPAQALAEEILELNRSFIEKYKNHLTISVNYFVDAAHKQPNPADRDGDMHLAGRSSHIGIATVAEIQNAKDAGVAIQIMKNVLGTNQTVAVTGVWRIWPEHGGDKEHAQRTGAGTRYTGPGPTNPPHVFEIHPILQVESEDLRATLKPIPEFTPKTAREAFERYERGHFEIKATPKAKRVHMSMRMVGFNYVEFLMKLNKRFERVADGEFVSAAIYTLNEEMIVHDRRIGFIQGTAPDEKQKTLAVGQCIRVLGIPRVDLALVSWRIRNAPTKPDVLKWSMPYEIIAIGIYDDQPRECGDE